MQGGVHLVGVLMLKTFAFFVILFFCIYLFDFNYFFIYFIFYITLILKSVYQVHKLEYGVIAAKVINEENFNINEWKIGFQLA